ncbi:MAG: sensor histidine kinase [Hahellaceae bacterium]|nr:sensor histidine kinase [Hahellaceae bacterium]
MPTSYSSSFFHTSLPRCFSRLLSSVAMASAGIASLKAGSRQARFYLAAWSVLLLSSFLFLFRLMGLLPSDWFTLYAVQIGSVIEAVLLSLGLADRINLLKAEALKTEQSANKLKDEFMSTITHELLTPVNGIRLSLDLLKDKFITSEDKQLYQTANDSNSHLLKLIESMFTFVEARRGSIKLEESLVRFKQSCENVFNYFHNSKKNGVSLDFIWDAQLPDYVLLDEKKFTLVLSQLMKNACSYTKSGSVVMSLTLEGDSHCRVSVKDTGIGIDSEKLDTLFEAFNQADNSLKREHGGLGIGLS